MGRVKEPHGSFALSQASVRAFTSVYVPSSVTMILYMFRILEYPAIGAACEIELCIYKSQANNERKYLLELGCAVFSGTVRLTQSMSDKSTRIQTTREFTFSVNAVRPAEFSLV